MNHPSPSLQEFYRRWYRIYETMIAVIGHQRMVERYLFHVSLTPGMKILDAGCGSGAATKAIMSVMKKQGIDGATFHGFDFTEAAVHDFNAFAAREHLLTMTAVASNALALNETLPSDWREYDMIISSGMLEYLSFHELIHALSLLRERMTPNGRIILFISRPSLFNSLFLGKIWKAHCYSSSELRQLFHDADFRISSLVPFQSWGYAIEATL